MLINIQLAFTHLLPSFYFTDLLAGTAAAVFLKLAVVYRGKNAKKFPARRRIWLRPMECIILSVKDTYMDAQEVMHMTDYSKITALYSRLSVGDEDRDGGESNSIQNQKIFLENYARGQHLTNIRHYIDDDESGRFFDRSALFPHDGRCRKRKNRCLHYERPDALGGATISKLATLWRYSDGTMCALSRSTTG